MIALTVSTFDFLSAAQAHSGFGAFRALAGALTDGTLTDEGPCDMPAGFAVKASQSQVNTAAIAPTWEPIRRDAGDAGVALAREIQMVMLG